MRPLQKMAKFRPKGQKLCIVLHGIVWYHIVLHGIALRLMISRSTSARRLYLARHLSTLFFQACDENNQSIALYFLYFFLENQESVSYCRAITFGRHNISFDFQKRRLLNLNSMSHSKTMSEAWYNFEHLTGYQRKQYVRPLWPSIYLECRPLMDHQLVIYTRLFSMICEQLIANW